MSSSIQSDLSVHRAAGFLVLVMSHAAHDATFMLFRQQKMACSNTCSAVDMCDVVKIDFGDSAGMKVSQALIFFKFSFFLQ